MREILFRGKREDSREWVYGYLNRHPSPVQIGDYNNPWTIHVPPADPDDNGRVYWIDPSTIGQYTGLTDKNGAKIFEGDIVRFVEWRRGDACWVGSVSYDYGSMFVVRGGENKECKTEFEIQLSRIDKKRIAVIGNIHDNPELLK